MSKEHGSGHGTEMVYIVEARSTYSMPQDANGMTLDNRWRPVTFQKSPIGIANDAYSAEALRYNGYLGFKAAMALAHWFMSSGGFCVETRLVKVKLVSSYSTEEVGVGAPMSLIRAEREAVFSERTELAMSVDAVDPSVGIRER